MKIGKRKIGSEYPVFIVAEAGINHNGDIEIAKEMIESVSKSGCDAIKFQTLFPEELFSQKLNPDWYDLINKWVLSKNQHIQLIKHAKKNNIEFFSTPVGLKSAKLLQSVNVNCIKIASGELTNHEMVNAIAKMKIPMIVSTGMSTISEIMSVVELLEKQNAVFSILHCNASYPSPIEDSNLLTIPHFRNIFNVPIGYSDHTIGNEACFAAVSLGACIVEKHFTLDKKMDGPDQKLSADPKQFSLLSSKIRLIEKSLGIVRDGPTNSEGKFRKTMRKSIGASKDIAAGTKITRSMLQLFRPGTGIPPTKLDSIIGMKISKNVKKGDMLNWEMF